MFNNSKIDFIQEYHNRCRDQGKQVSVMVEEINWARLASEHNKEE